MKKNKNINFAENPIYLLILFIKLKKNQIFLISQKFEISFNKELWKCQFCQNFYAFTIISYKTKKKSKFLNFKDFKNFIQ